MTATEAQTISDWLEKVHGLAPLIEKFRDEGERQRHLPDEIFRALHEADFFRLWVPRTYGGYEVDLVSFQEIVEEVSRLDGAVGWNLMIGAEGGAIAAHFPPEVAQHIYEGGTVGAGSTMPSGRAEVLSSGYRVTGRWPLASGCQHAGWMIGTSVVTENGQPRVTENNSPELRMMLFSSADCEIQDTWFSNGLRGTGSHHFAVEDIVVPSEHSFMFPPVLENPPGPLFRAPLPVLLAAPLASVALGIARDAIDSFIELAQEKTPARGTSRLADRQVNHLRVGEAKALLHSASCFLHDSARQYMQGLEAGPVPMNDERTILLRLAGSNAAQCAVQVVDLMYTAAGSSSIYEGNRIERCSRDVRMVTQHVGVAPSNIEAVGAHYLGLEGQPGR